MFKNFATKFIEIATSKVVVYVIKVGTAIVAGLTFANAEAEAAKYRRENLKTPKE